MLRDALIQDLREPCQPLPRDALRQRSREQVGEDLPPHQIAFVWRTAGIEIRPERERVLDQRFLSKRRLVAWWKNSVRLAHEHVREEPQPVDIGPRERRVEVAPVKLDKTVAELLLRRHARKELTRSARRVHAFLVAQHTVPCALSSRA